MFTRGRTSSNVKKKRAMVVKRWIVFCLQTKFKHHVQHVTFSAIPVRNDAKMMHCKKWTGCKRSLASAVWKAGRLSPHHQIRSIWRWCTFAKHSFRFVVEQWNASSALHNSLGFVDNLTWNWPESKKAPHRTLHSIGLNDHFVWGAVASFTRFPGLFFGLAAMFFIHFLHWLCPGVLTVVVGWDGGRGWPAVLASLLWHVTAARGQWEAAPWGTRSGRESTRPVRIAKNTLCTAFEY